MTIRHTLTRADLLLLNLHVLVRRKFLYALSTGLILFTIYGELKRPELLERGTGYIVFYLCIMSCLLFTWVFGAVIMVTFVLVLLNKNRGILGEHRLTITETGITEATEYNESLFKWAAYQGTTWTRRLIILKVSEGMYYAIPRKRPLIEGDLAKFEELLRLKTEEARKLQR